MELSNEAKSLIDFVDRWGSVDLLSTGAEVESFAGVLYNVDGSRGDPNIGGFSWKGLLLANGITGNCYVTNVKPPSESSHPEFSLGGHMTVNSDGSVGPDGTCYLMPLCYWHNSKKRDGEAFTHTEVKMLKLFGYMKDEPNVTFMARYPSDKKYSIVPLSGSKTDLPLVSELRRGNQKQSLRQELEEEGLSPYFVMFVQKKRDGVVYNIIEEAHLPN